MHVVLGIIAACIGIIAGIWQLQERCGGRPLVGCVYQKFFGSDASCIPGTRIEPSSETFHLKVLAVQEDEALQELLKRAKEERNWEIAHSIVRAVDEGKIKPIFEDARAMIQLYGINYDLPPTEVPFLAGKQICQGMVKLLKGADGTLVAQVDLKGGRHRGEIALVLPRRLFVGSPEANVCIEPSFRLANHRDGRQKVYCDRAGQAGLYDSVNRAQQVRTTILIRRKD